MEIVIIMRKKIVPVIIFILCMQAFSLNFVFGDTVVEQVKDTTQTDNVLIKNVLRPLSIEQYEVKIFDEDNNDVTENWKSKLHQLVYKGSPHDIEAVIQKNHLNIYATEKNYYSLRATRRQYYSESVEDKGSSNGYTVDWKIMISGSITYNFNSKRITEASSPTVTLVTSSDSTMPLHLYITDVHPSRNIYPSYVYSYASYTIRGYKPLFNCSFGSHLVDTYVYPKF